MKLLKTFLGVAALSVSATALATPTTILPGPETPLQTVINNLYSCGSCSNVSNAPNVNTDQQSPDQLWQIEASGTATATLIIEIAGNANLNNFGLYDAYNPSNHIQLFAGSANQGDRATILMDSSGHVTVIYTNNGVFAGLESGSLTSNLFGFYLGTPGPTFYSQMALNNGEDHMVAFRGDGSTIQLPGAMPGAWGSSSYILAWEDLPFATSDRDYNDFVVYVESVRPVPEPATLALLGLGLAGVGFAARRRRKK